MSRILASSRVVLSAALLASLVCLPVGAETYDEGLLETAWFGGDREFREADEIDYLWVKDGFSLEGKTLHFEEWPEHEFLGEKASERDAEDHRLARQMTADMHQLFADSWKGMGGASTSLENGDILVTGRIVDCSGGNMAAKMLVGFGAGSGNTTIDLKFVDKASGEVVAALHQRVVSGTSWSTTDSKFVKWTGKFAQQVDKRGGLAGLYARGERRKG